MKLSHESGRPLTRRDLEATRAFPPGVSGGKRPFGGSTISEVRELGSTRPLSNQCAL